ncbi:MAG: DNA helicase-2/ATP-dependent DNA helicase PcrA [Planctomycetota bacterium]|jgi:DNA helicase-2/ATP-dependent DNA helicase PcrA
MSKHLKGLNPEQHKAVTTTKGPLLVLAGAGTGKTRVITHRIAELLSKGIKPHNILAVTFTNKASGEMRERLKSLVGKRAKDVTVSTFHAFCLHTLREHKDVMGWPKGFTLCDAADQLSVHKSSLRELRVAETSMPAPKLAGIISLLKNKGISAEEYVNRPGDDEDELVARAWLRYQAKLKRSRRLDFDDLLLECVRLYRDHKDVLQEHRDRYRYVLVDEYQDTNGVQYGVINAITREHKNLCVVGDDDQSIYGWRGADITKILSFEKDYPGATIVKLETNYRSTRDILTLANRLIAHNTGRHEKVLRSHIGSGELVQGVTQKDELTEAEYIIKEILQAKKDAKYQFGDTAILFRTAMQPRAFEAELRANDIPYVLVGGMSFFDRKEVRDVIAFLRLIVNPDDESSLLRIINTPPRGVGKSTIDRALAFATEHGLTALTAFERADEIEKINPAAVDAVLRLTDRLKSIGEEFPSSQVVDITRAVVERCSYRDELERLYPDKLDQDRRWAAVEEVVNFAENFSNRHKAPTLAKFLNELCLNADDRHDSAKHDRDAVTLMTLHASKGLEFPSVYLVGMEEGLLPHNRSVAEDSIEEERRLAYVGITRAQRSLTLSHCLERAKYGTRVKSHPSRFLFEIKGQSPPEDWEPAGESEAKTARLKKKGKKGRRKARRRIGR